MPTQQRLIATCHWTPNQISQQMKLTLTTRQVWSCTQNWALSNTSQTCKALRMPKHRVHMAPNSSTPIATNTTKEAIHLNRCWSMKKMKKKNSKKNLRRNWRRSFLRSSWIQFQTSLRMTLMRSILMPLHSLTCTSSTRKKNPDSNRSLLKNIWPKKLSRRKPYSESKKRRKS